MHSANDEELQRIGAETQAHVRTAHESCADGARHVEASRRAVERSLRLLDEPVHHGAEGKEA